MTLPSRAPSKGYIDDAKKDLETAKTRKEVYEIISDFVKDVDKVQTKAEKELEAALKEAEEAKKRYGNNNDNSSNSTYDNNGSTTTDTDDSGYKSNSLNSGSDDEEESGGLLNSLFGGMASGSGGN